MAQRFCVLVALLLATCGSCSRRGRLLPHMGSVRPPLQVYQSQAPAMKKVAPMAGLASSEGVIRPKPGHVSRPSFGPSSDTFHSHKPRATFTGARIPHGQVDDFRARARPVLALGNAGFDATNGLQEDYHVASMWDNPPKSPRPPTSNGSMKVILPVLLAGIGALAGSYLGRKRLLTTSRMDSAGKALSGSDQPTMASTTQANVPSSTLSKMTGARGPNLFARGFQSAERAWWKFQGLTSRGADDSASSDIVKTQSSKMYGVLPPNGADGVHNTAWLGCLLLALRAAGGTGTPVRGLIYVYGAAVGFRQLVKLFYMQGLVQLVSFKDSFLERPVGLLALGGLAALGVVGICEVAPAARVPLATAAVLHSLYWFATYRSGGIWRGAMCGCVIALAIDAYLAPTGVRFPLPTAALLASWFLLSDIREDRSEKGAQVRSLRNTHSTTTVARVAAGLHTYILFFIASTLTTKHRTDWALLIGHFIFAIFDVRNIFTSYGPSKRVVAGLRQILTGIWPFVLIRLMPAASDHARSFALIPSVLSQMGRVFVPNASLVSQAIVSPAFLATFVATAVYSAEYNTLLGDRSSRKALHMGIGGLLLLLRPPRPLITLFAFGVMLFEAFCGYFKIKFRFARDAFDLGMFEYAFLLILTAESGLPWSVLAPAFFADPAAMLIGSKFRSKQWYGNKTVAGSLAAFVITTLVVGGSIPGRILAGILVVTAEAFGGRHDNICVGLTCLTIGFLRARGFYP